MQETIHIIKDELQTRCGLAWAINYIGCCRKNQVEEYRQRPDCRICIRCEANIPPGAPSKLMANGVRLHLVGLR